MDESDNKSDNEPVVLSKKELRVWRALAIRDAFFKFARISGPDYMLPLRQLEPFCMQVALDLEGATTDE